MNTKIDSFNQLTETAKQRSDVLKAIWKLKEPNNREISVYTGKPINVVTARVNELFNSGAVELGGYKYDKKTNRTTKFWI